MTTSLEYQLGGNACLRPTHEEMEAFFGSNKNGCIPYEIALEIFKYLNPKKMANIREVSKSWNKLILSSLKLQAPIVLRKVVFLAKKELVSMPDLFRRHLSKIAKLEVAFAPTFAYETIDKVLADLQDKQPYLMEVLKEVVKSEIRFNPLNVFEITQKVINRYQLDKSYWLGFIKEVALVDCEKAYEIAGSLEEGKDLALLQVFSIELSKNLSSARSRALQFEINKTKEKLLQLLAVFEAKSNPLQSTNTLNLINDQNIKAETALYVVKVREKNNFSLLRTYAKLIPDNVKAYQELVDIAEQDMSDPLIDLKETINKFPRLADRYNGLEKCLTIELKRNREEAIETFKSMLELNKNIENIAIYNSLCKENLLILKEGILPLSGDKLKINLLEVIEQIEAEKLQKLSQKPLDQRSQCIFERLEKNNLLEALNLAEDIENSESKVLTYYRIGRIALKYIEN